MKVLLLLLAAVLVAGCDMDKVTGIQTDATPVPAPKATPTPVPKPKQGEWMLKNYKRPLDSPAKNK